ncbi:uncharacterized protein LOC128205447 [Mya arenaria]|uniref:uncharacterized protein LOC128205447 n=2 Tax=Mya arenaria TaxID=6604 RepID=UPI0022DF3011|nr:uncharacterized protein LOC128205447 [Mya arenaria]
MYCHICGKERRGDAQFCASCGTKLDDIAAGDSGSVKERRPSTCSEQEPTLSLKERLEVFRMKQRPLQSNTKRGRKESTHTTGIVKKGKFELSVLFLDGGHHILKRLFPSPTGPTGTLTISVSENSNSSDWLKAISSKFINTSFTLCTPSGCGFQAIEQPVGLEFVRDLKKAKHYKLLRIYVQADTKGKANYSHHFTSTTQPPIITLNKH